MLYPLWYSIHRWYHEALFAMLARDLSPYSKIKNGNIAKTFI
jgi:hypothetical protein